MRERSQPKRITLEEFVKRSHLNIQYKIAKLEAKFIEKVANATPTEFMGLLEEHFLERFDVWALAFAPFAKSPTSIGVHPDYIESAHRGEGASTI
jgi:hypothetical protein